MRRAALIAPRYTLFMEPMEAVANLRARRLASAMTQRELADRSGVPQPNIAAYETGRRRPAPSTLAKLDAVLRHPTMQRLRAARSELIRAASARDLTDLRVFGSVARGSAGPGSDVDLLVHPGAAASVFDLAGFMDEAQELLGVHVDVVSDRGSGPTIDRIRSEAVPL